MDRVSSMFFVWVSVSEMRARWDKKMIDDDVKKYGRGHAGAGDFENTDEEEYDELNGEDTSLVQLLLAMPQTSNTADDPED